MVGQLVRCWKEERMWLVHCWKEGNGSSVEEVRLWVVGEINRGVSAKLAAHAP